ncbi:uncharacterized protein LOC126897231 isoform X2 [Daktulosphaira vitifoliae]|uniref:uncharacterized protein LOC126897231 isoform X2 n=1 Tax=Daktulosphaira vitifoliae TaxID=58002 RepID=UPI0021AA34F0|nr:uncharacterized protein LOC126897231 isoform X2 [Daktulosphaira vitifoliae]
MANSYDIDEIKTNLKATITSNKGGVDISMVEKDYLNIVGEPLPYNKLGFKNIIDFIKSLGTFNLEKRGPSIIVHCMSSDKTQHLEKMIQRQKSVKKKSKRKKQSSYYGSNAMNKINYYKSSQSVQMFHSKKLPYSSNTHKASYNNYSKIPSYNNHSKTSSYNNYAKATTYNNRGASSYSVNTKTQSYNSFAKTSSNNSYNKKPVTNSASTQYNNKSAKTPITNCKTEVSKSIVTISQSSFDVKPNVAIEAVKNVSVTPTKASSLSNNFVLKPQSAQSRLEKFVKKQISSLENSECHCNTTAPCTKLKFDDESKMSKPVIIDRSRLFKKPESTENNESKGICKSEDKNEYFDSIIAQQTLQNKEKGTIKAVYSYCSIWIVLDDVCFKEKYLTMQRNLNIFMSNNYSKKVINDIKENRYYAFYDSIEWHRIIVKNFLINGKVEVFFIDTGKSKCVLKDQIYHLDAEYYKIEAQAIEFSLGKFKSISEFQIFKDLLVQTLVDKKFIVSPNNVTSTPSTINIFDAETLANIYDVVINKFIEICTPRLNSSTEENVIEAKVMSIVDGYWYIQLKDSVLLPLFEKLFSEDEFSSPCLRNIRDVNYKNVYLTNLTDKIKGRVKVLHLVDESRVKVFFIDYGKSKIVNSKDLVEVNKIEPLIARLPYQAMKIVLQLFSPNCVTDKTIELFYQIVGESELPVVGLLNVSYHDKYKAPCAQFCSKLYPNTILNMVLYKRLQDSKK